MKLFVFTMFESSVHSRYRYLHWSSIISFPWKMINVWFVILLSPNTCFIPNFIFQELDSQKKKALQIECEKGNKNDLLEYLRSLDPEMVVNVEVSLILIHSQSSRSSV